MPDMLNNQPSSMQSDAFLEGLDDIDASVDDAWIAAIQKMNTRASRRTSKKERRLPAATSDPENPFAYYYKQRRQTHRREISRRKEAARLRTAMSNAMLDSVETSLKNINKPKPKPETEGK